MWRGGRKKENVPCFCVMFAAEVSMETLQEQCCKSLANFSWNCFPSLIVFWGAVCHRFIFCILRKDCLLILNLESGVSEGSWWDPLPADGWGMAQSSSWWYRIQVEQDTAFPAGSPRFCDRAGSIEHAHNQIRAAAGRGGEGSQVRPPRSWCCRWGSRREPGVPRNIGVHMGRMGIRNHYQAQLNKKSPFSACSPDEAKGRIYRAQDRYFINPSKLQKRLHLPPSVCGC